MLKTLWYFEKITKNSQNFGQKGAKKEENPFFIFRPPFFAEKRKIEKKRKTKIFRFIATHSNNEKRGRVTQVDRAAWHRTEEEKLLMMIKIFCVKIQRWQSDLVSLRSSKHQSEAGQIKDPTIWRYFYQNNHLLEKFLLLKRKKKKKRVEIFVS